MTCLKFHWLFLILTVIQVTICCVVVWYLGDENARSIVNVLSRQIRSEILTKVQYDIIKLLVDCITSADQMYSTIIEQPNLANILLHETCVSPFNTSFLFPSAVLLARYATIPQLGYLTPRGVAILGRRPDMMAGYLRSNSTKTVACAYDNDGSDGCFFEREPLFSALVADPDENREFGIQENIDPARYGTNPQMGGAQYFVNWPFNLKEYRRLKNMTTSDDLMWNPYHAESDFHPFQDGPTTSAVLREYSDLKYDEALRLGLPLPRNSTTILEPPTVQTGDLRNRTTYIDAVVLNGHLGWSRTFLGLNNQVAIGAVKAYMDPNVSDGVGFVVYSTLYYNSISSVILDNLKSNFRDPDTNATPNTEVLIFERSGLLVATTLSDLDSASQLIVRTNIFTSNHPFISSMRDELVSSGLIRSDNPSVPRMVNITETSSMASREYNNLLIDESFHAYGSRWHMRAGAIPTVVGVEWIVVVATLNSDFDAGFSENSKNTGYFSALVGVVSIIVTLIVVQMLTRPLMKLVDFMQDISWRLVESKDDSQKQNADLNELRTIWHKSMQKPELMKGNVDEELAELRRRRRRAMKRQKGRTMTRVGASGASGTSPDTNTSSRNGPFSTSDSPQSRSRHSGSSDEASSNETTNGNHSDSSYHSSDHEHGSNRHPGSHSNGTSGQSHTMQDIDEESDTRRWYHVWYRRVRRLLCARLPRRLNRCLPTVSFRETQLLHRTFGAMLTGLQSSHEMLQTANESKRRFIRYIFHEVRVPFNAIVLGVEQLREDLYTEPLRPTEEMQDVVNILNEQSKVVARILNDVLSLQKIEDGALVLERQPFNMLEMVIGTLRSFQPLFAEKNLILVTEMESIEQAIKRVITHPHSHRLSPETDKGDDTHSLAIPPSMSPMDPKHDHTLITVASSDPLPASPSAPLLATVTSTTNGFNSTPTTSEASPATTDTSSASPIRANDLAPLTTIISPPNSSPDEYYSNAYEDSKELQRFAAVCSREVIGDRYRLRQVLANFLSNAVKFSSYSGIVKVRVKCSFDEDEIQPIYMNMNSSTITPLISAHTLNSNTNTTGSQPVETDADGKPIHNSIKVEDIATPIDQQPHTSSPIDVPSTSPIPLPPLSSSSSSSSTSSIASSYCPARVRIRVEVEDTGRGLSSSELKQMFKPYVQFKSGEQQQGKGQHHSTSADTQRCSNIYIGV